MNSLINEKLNETRENLIEEISALKNDSFNAKPDKAKWSIAQVCHHLALVELATIKAIYWGLRQKESQGLIEKIFIYIRSVRRKFKPQK